MLNATKGMKQTFNLTNTNPEVEHGGGSINPY